MREIQSESEKYRQKEIEKEEERETDSERDGEKGTTDFQLSGAITSIKIESGLFCSLHEPL